MYRDQSPSALEAHNLKHERFAAKYHQGGLTQPEGPGDTAPDSPIYNGRHVPKIQLSDGKTLWLWYFLTDAGRVANVEVLVTRLFQVARPRGADASPTGDRLSWATTL